MLVGRLRLVVGGLGLLSQRAFGADGTSQNLIAFGFRGRPKYKSLDTKWVFQKMLKKMEKNEKIIICFSKLL